MVIQIIKLGDLGFVSQSQYDKNIDNLKNNIQKQINKPNIIFETITVSDQSIIDYWVHIYNIKTT